ncbi:Hypothetical predicted protein, partial [Marmota monax]
EPSTELTEVSDLARQAVNLAARERSGPGAAVTPRSRRAALWHRSPSPVPTAAGASPPHPSRARAVASSAWMPAGAVADTWQPGLQVQPGSKVLPFGRAGSDSQK